jgi:threonine dehydrogenase-like Zn-dependent dehydrogenase
MEFNQSLASIADGEIDVVPMITGEVGIDGVPDAFEALGNPEEHCKILVVPS